MDLFNLYTILFSVETLKSKLILVSGTANPELFTLTAVTTPVHNYTFKHSCSVTAKDVQRKLPILNTVIHILSTPDQGRYTVLLTFLKIW